MPHSFIKDFPTPRQTRLGLLVLVPLALVLGPRALAWADLQIKTAWSKGDKLSATEMGDQFAKIKTAIDKPSVTLGAVQFGRTGKYLGKSDPTTGKWVSGALVGYAAGKKICEDKFQSPTAHVCSADEVIQNAAVNPGAFSIGQAWIVGGTQYFDMRPNANKQEILVMQNCTGWTSNIGLEDGSSLIHYDGPSFNKNNEGAVVPSTEHCNDSFPIHCCD